VLEPLGAEVEIVVGRTIWLGPSSRKGDVEAVVAVAAAAAVVLLVVAVLVAAPATRVFVAALALTKFAVEDRAEGAIVPETFRN